MPSSGLRCEDPLPVALAGGQRCLPAPVGHPPCTSLTRGCGGGLWRVQPARAGSLPTTGPSFSMAGPDPRPSAPGVPTSALFVTVQGWGGPHCRLCPLLPGDLNWGWPL